MGLGMDRDMVEVELLVAFALVSFRRLLCDCGCACAYEYG